MPISLKENRDALDHRSRPSNERNQHRRMLMALALLLTALIILLVKDSQWWSGSRTGDQSATAEPVATPTPAPASIPASGMTASAPAPPAPQVTAESQQKKPKTKTTTSAAPAPAPEAQSSGPVITATNRTVLPPLNVEVVAGNQRRELPASNNSVKVEMQGSTETTTPAIPEPVPESAPVPNASTQVTMPPNAADRVASSVEPSYPTLARQMKVQGAVVLQVLIDRGGNIEQLHVVSGPSILATAAQQAVKQWHFKPYYQQGQAVETEARVTVNFTISTY
jgi:periplasmic protein TonB